MVNEWFTSSSILRFASSAALVVFQKICARATAAECSERLTFDLHFLDGVFQRHPFKLGYYDLEE
jgi:hypothetical protein